MSDAAPQRPTSGGRNEWQAYWTAQGEPWRTEPEILPERQRELAERRDTITPDIEKGIYPFKESRLSRADVEWLLHEHGLIDWTDEGQRNRQGLDLRGAVFSKTSNHAATNLSGLPLTRTRFGLDNNEWSSASSEQREHAAAHLERGSLYEAHLEGAIFRAVHLEGANLIGADLRESLLMSAHLEGVALHQAHIERAVLSESHLEGANLSETHLEGALLVAAHLEGAILRDAHLEGAVIRYGHLEGVDLISAHLEEAFLSKAHLEGADIRAAYLEGADLSNSHLEGANLHLAHLERANLSEAHLEGADLSETQMERATLRAAHLGGKRLTDDEYMRIQNAQREDGIAVPQVLPPADLRLSFFNEATILNDLTIGDAHQCIRLADVRWGGVNLAVISWAAQNITLLGDEIESCKTVNADGKPKERTERIRDWEAAVRAYRQLAVALRAQGMNEVADKFAYRAQLCQRRVMRIQRKGGYFWSSFLDLLAGYGYAPERTLLGYLFVITAYSVCFFLFGQSETHPLSSLGSVIFSITSFHGRGFFPGGLALDDPLTVIAATEAIIGLLIEVSFIATFTQRFFSR